MLTSLGPGYDAQLTGNVDDGTSITWPSIMSSQGFLFDHTFQLFSRTQPTTTVINVDNLIKLVQGHFVALLGCAKDTGTVYCIVESAKFIDASTKQASDSVRRGNVGGNG